MNKYYYLDGSISVSNMPNDFKQLHRVDGPAIECTDGTKWWYLNGKRHTKEVYNNTIKEANEMCLALQLTDPREWVRELGRKQIQPKEIK